MSVSAETVRVTAVLACHNRKAMTLRCLASLKAAIPTGVSLSVVLFDDASTDGTAKAVQDMHPDVKIIQGDGNQFWCGGMRAAMRAAADEPYDFLLWLNDDVDLRKDSLAGLLREHARALAADSDRLHAIIGTLLDPTSDEIAYSGLRRTSPFHPAKLTKVTPDPTRLLPCDTMNGNCVLFPFALVREVGEIDPIHVQQIGDLDYGYRCVRSGARLWIASFPVGTCAQNDRRIRWRNPNLSFRERIGVLNTPHGLPVRPWLQFMWRYGGAMGVVLLFGGYIKWLAMSLVNRQSSAAG